MPEHPDFCWVDTAVGGAFRRNSLRDLRWRPPAGAVDAYRTWARFPEGFREHFEAHRDEKHPRGSVGGYAGPLYADFLPLDIDREDRADALEVARTLLQRLDARWDVPLEAPRVSFSGNKGFHVLLPAALFSPAPGDRLHLVFRFMARKLFDGLAFDEGVYDRTNLWRCANTRHGKSGLYAVPLTPAELLHLNMPQIEDLARAPRKVPLSPVEPCSALRELYDMAMAEVAQETPHGATAAERGDAEWAALWRGPWGEGNRHDTELKLIGHLWSHGLGAEEVLQLLRAWNRTACTPPKTGADEADIERDVRYSFEHYGDTDDTPPMAAEQAAVLFANLPQDVQDLIRDPDHAGRRKAGLLQAARLGTPRAALIAFALRRNGGDLDDARGLARWAVSVADRGGAARAS